MKKKDIDNHLSIHISRLYSFAFSLIPDELQAQQLVLDAYYVVSLKYKERLEELLACSSELRPRLGRELLISIYRQIMDIAAKREQHLSCALRFPKRFTTFFSRPAKERASLFLKHKSDLDIDEIGTVLGGDRFVAMASINIARNNIMTPETGGKLKAAVGQ